jgi:hypothetical protein
MTAIPTRLGCNIEDTKNRFFQTFRAVTQYT